MVYYKCINSNVIYSYAGLIDHKLVADTEGRFSRDAAHLVHVTRHMRILKVQISVCVSIERTVAVFVALIVGY